MNEDSLNLSFFVVAEASRGSIQSVQSVLKFMYITKHRLLDEIYDLRCLLAMRVLAPSKHGYRIYTSLKVQDQASQMLTP